jgi:hypothetical protein
VGHRLDPRGEVSQVDAFRATDRISDSDKVKLMGGTLTRIYGWSPNKGSSR